MITSELQRHDYVATPAQTVFPYQFLIQDKAELQVYVDATIQTVDTHYTVSGVGNEAGGNVTFLIAPATGAKIIIVGAVPVTQTLDYVNAGKFPSASHERGLDKLTRISLQLGEQLKRSPTLPIAQSFGVTQPMLLPPPVPNGYLKWNAAGTDLETALLTSAPSVVIQNPLTTKGDLLGFSAASARVPVGVNESILEADSAQAFGIKWSAPHIKKSIIVGRGDLIAGAETATPIRHAGGVDHEVLTFQTAQASGLRWTRTPMLNIQAFGAVGDGVTSNTAALNAAVTASVTYGVNEIFFPAGNYAFTTKPNDFTYGIRLVGTGITATVLTRAYTESDTTKGFLTWTGLNGNGGGCRDMALLAGQSTSGGSAIKLIASATLAPDHSRFDNLYITISGSPPGTWFRTVHCNGILRASPQGIRVVQFFNCNVFGSTDPATFLVNNCVGLNFYGGGIYPAGGSFGNLYVTGGGSYAVDRSSLCTFLTNVQGELNLGACELISFAGLAGSLATDASARNCRVDAIITGSLINNMTTSYVTTQTGVH